MTIVYTHLWLVMKRNISMKREIRNVCCEVLPFIKLMLRFFIYYPSRSLTIPDILTITND